MVAKHVAFDFLCIGHIKLHVTSRDHASVAHLATALRVERRGAQHHHTRLPRGHCFNRAAINIQAQHSGCGAQMLVAHKGVGRAGVVQRLVHFELACGTRLVFLARHGGIKASGVHLYLTLATNILCEV